MACLEDSEARLALDKEDPFSLQTKPHGHGDVHALLHATGLVETWRAAGIQWVCFFQDTNGLVFRGLPAALGNPPRLPRLEPTSKTRASASLAQIQDLHKLQLLAPAWDDSVWNNTSRQSGQQ